jgi:hypothetical protein
MMLFQKRFDFGVRHFAEKHGRWLHRFSNEKKLPASSYPLRPSRHLEAGSWQLEAVS